MPRRRNVAPPLYVFALDSVSIRAPGDKYPTRVPRGSAWHADCPLVRAHPDLFTDAPLEVFPRDWQPPVEQATAAPGELRETARG